MAKKSYKQLFESKQVTEELLLSCLTTCEHIIISNACLEKQWSGGYGYMAEPYTEERLKWSGYREKIRKALQSRYEMKKIIAMSKTHKEQVAPRIVKKAVELIDSGDYTLI